MPKITYIGAGSAVFARQVITDILAIDGLDDGEIALVDVDERRLDLATRLVDKLVERSGKSYKVHATTQRNDVLAGSDYVVNSIEVAGLQNVRHDYDIPLTYGVDQCIGDTIGPGGIFKALRTGPAWLDICRDIQRACPHATVLNFTNPMSILTLAALRATDLQVVGLCHSVQGTSGQLARYLGVPYPELTWECAGINHNAWFTKLERDGEDMYPLLRERARDSDVYEQDPVRFETMLHLGYFVTESSGHFSEYVPWFRKRPELIQRYTRAGYKGESGFYANNWPTWRAKSDEWIEDLIAGRREIPSTRSSEYAADIVEAKELNRPKVIYGNVRNESLVDNLPDGCVEVACLVDRRGVQPCRFGPLPEQCAAMNRSHMAVHELVVRALLDRDREAARHALMLDPLTAAVCSLQEIGSMFDEMWTAQEDFLAAYWNLPVGMVKIASQADTGGGRWKSTGRFSRWSPTARSPSSRASGSWKPFGTQPSPRSNSSLRPASMFRGPRSSARSAGRSPPTPRPGSSTGRAACARRGPVAPSTRSCASPRRASLPTTSARCRRCSKMCRSTRSCRCPRWA